MEGKKETMVMAHRALRVVIVRRAFDGGAQSDETEKSIEIARRWRIER